MRQDFSGVILCGGKSRRMGWNKARLPLGEGRVIDRILKNLEPIEDLWLSVGSGESYPDVCLPKVSDRYPDSGPMGGLESGLIIAKNPYVFFTAVDMPFVDYALAEELYMKMSSDPDLDALLVRDGRGRDQHLLGMYHKRVLPFLTRRLEDGGKDRLRIQEFLREIRVEYLEAGQVADGEIKTATGNTPEEYFSLPGVPPVLSVTGWSGSGKTGWIESVLPCFLARKIRVAVIKHDAHHFEIDREGKDTWRFARAGACTCGIFSSEAAALMDYRPLTLVQMLGRIRDVDLILLEGGSTTPFPKILVCREALGRGMRVEPSECLAVISDDRVGSGCDRFGFGQREEAVDYIIKMFGL